MNAAKKVSRPFVAKYPGNCSLSGRPIKVGDQVQFVNDRVALVAAASAAAAPVAPAPVAAKAPAAKAAPAGRPGRRPADARADGRCGFCRSTPVAACPMCGWSAVAPKIVLTVPAAAPAPAAKVTFASLSDEKKSRAVEAIRAAFAKNEPMIAAALLVGISGVLHADAYVEELVDMDARSLAAGFITVADVDRREWIVRNAIAALGFDPRQAPAPAPAPVQAAPALTAGDAAPLQAGDWSELWRRVKAGSISEADAVQFGQLWTQKK